MKKGHFANGPLRGRKADPWKGGQRISAEVVDLRTIRPLDEDTIFESVRKTHRAVCVDENKPFCAVSSQIAASIGLHCFDDLDAPVQRISSLDAPAFYTPRLRSSSSPTPT